VSFGERLRERRKALQITQEELANALNVTPQHISLIEQGKTSPSLSLIPRIAKELGISSDYLLTGKDAAITKPIAGPIAAIKADKRLSQKSKKLLVGLVEELSEFS